MTLLQATGWTLVHFLWQGALIVALFALIDTALRHRSAKARYATASLAMLLMLLCAAATFLVLMGEPGSSEPVTRVPAPGLVPIAPGSAAPITHGKGSLSLPYLPWLVYLWMAGVTALSARMAMQWIRLHRFRRSGLSLLDQEWQQTIGGLANRLGLRRTVLAYESALADVPAVIGWLRPVVLVPTSALLQLSPDMIEALLAHELAHVRRHDYLINLLQSCVETLFFYHPGVWWVGRRMREERENCCDDLAVAICGDPIIYARALADLEQSRNAISQLAMAANGGSLLLRIRRLIAPHRETRPVAPLAAATLTLLLAALVVWAPAPASAQRPAPKQPELRAQTQTPNPANSQSPGPAAGRRVAQSKNVPTISGESYIDQMSRAGFTNLTADQMIAMKIHGVTPQYIAEIKALGFTPTSDQLIAFRVHGVDAATLKELRSLGFGLTADQAIAANVHHITPAYINEWKQIGLKDLTWDKIVALRVHGANPSDSAVFKQLGFGDLSADDIVSLRVHGVTPDFVREARKYGFRDLRLEQIVQLKNLGILGSKESN